MILTIAKIGQDPTVAFACEELTRYLKQMDPTLFIAPRQYEEIDSSLDRVLWLGMDGTVEPGDSDEILIDVQGGAGRIIGANPRAVLIAAYRFLRELGCRFLRPGSVGEVIPARLLDEAALTVSVRETPSYRHRAMCIEGAVGYEHVYNMIDWLPKVGMNGYFRQFQVPGGFFRNFYDGSNPHMPAAPVTDEDVAHMWTSLEGDLLKRGLDYHAVGHGWTCESLGFHVSGWDEMSDPIPENVKPYLALLNGERTLYKKATACTNLCYSNPVVRNYITDAILKYCKENPATSFLHFWLADWDNNHCECEECSKMRPSDYYVMMLNELDEKLTAAGLSTRVVFLVYLDLLWEPEHTKLNNPDRFVLMFAPITRSYYKAFTDYDASKPVELVPYERNKLKMPTEVAVNVARLARWQQWQPTNSSFDFDYHLMWFHYSDPGYYSCARVLHEDMVSLHKIGLDGMVSCQVQRAAFPTGLPMYAMAAGLWDKTSAFEDVSAEYFTAAFGADGAAVEAYLSKLSELLTLEGVRVGSEDADTRAAMTARWEEAKALVEAFKREYLSVKREENPSWKDLTYHAEMCLLYTDLLKAAFGTERDADNKAAAIEALKEYALSVEPHIHTSFDAKTFQTLFTRYFW